MADFPLAGIALGRYLAFGYFAYGMPEVYVANVVNIYCDESGHLENDRQPVMVLGAMWCPSDATGRIAREMRDIKRQHGLNPHTFEIKWTKVSPGGLAFYRHVVDYFFDCRDLHFRAVVIPDKAQLRHACFDQTHDDWYYKMYFTLLKAVFDRNDHYRIYLDIKDTRSAGKVRQLEQVLRNSQYDFDSQIIERVQHVRSHEAEILQLADLLIGTVGYANRGWFESPAKSDVVSQVQSRSGYSLTRTTLLREYKCNLLIWRARETPDV